ncbi:MAG: phosphodiester glycosidase family protein [Gammaproteobacteria bacterium]|nr:phosphodiester glycosidase family protein [Gammaproteobacteria bacterium]
MPRQTIDLVKISPAFQWVTSALLLLFFINYSCAASNWRTLVPGIEYQDLDGSFLTPWSHVHVFRINLKNNELSLVTAKDLAREHASIEEYSEFSKALLAINGGFFDNHYKPLGLRIYHKRQQSPAKNISWWGIFYIKNQKPHLTSASQYSPDRQIEFAIQSGPRLLINNRIPALKPGRAERSALGITHDGRVIILVTDNMPLSTTELAQLMKAQPLNCENALNLDGGSSSQLRAHLGTFQLDVHGFSNVSDAVIVKAKTPN